MEGYNFWSVAGSSADQPCLTLRLQHVSFFSQGLLEELGGIGTPSIVHRERPKVGANLEICGDSEMDLLSERWGGLGIYVVLLRMVTNKACRHAR